MDLTHGKLIDPKSDPRTGRRDPDTAVPNWRDFVDVQPWESSPDGGAPYFRDNATGSKVTSYPYGIIDNYVKNYQAEMTRRMQEEANKKAEEAAKPKDVPMPKDAPATRGTPLAATAAKPPKTAAITGLTPIFKIDPETGKPAIDSKTGFEIITAFTATSETQKFTFKNNGKLPGFDFFLGNYRADPVNAPKVVYDLDTVNLGVTPRIDAAGPDMTVMPRLRPTPDTYLNPIVTELPDEIDADGNTYRVFSIVTEEVRFDENGKPIVDKNGDAIYFPLERTFRALVGSPMPLVRGAPVKPMPVPPPKPKDNLDGPPSPATEAAIQDALKRMAELQKKMAKMKAEQNKGEDEE